jgi:arginyl-tRNA synthetase
MTVFELKEKITKALFDAVKEYGVSVDQIVLEHPEVEDFGDYSCNIAMRLAKQLKKSPIAIAGEIVRKISVNQYIGKSVDQYAGNQESIVEKVEVKAQGFINFWIKKEALFEVLQKDFEFPKTDKRVMVEFTDPNPFKEFHIGHLYSNCVGECLSRLFEATGNEVHRACYQGDVGMHVAKSLFGVIWKFEIRNSKLEINKEKLKEKVKELEEKSLEERIKFLGEAYALGATKYEEDETAKEEINQLNKKIYEQDDEIKVIYDKGREWSLAYFEKIYQRLGMNPKNSGKCFDHYYFESAVGQTGLKLVKEYLSKSIFQLSDGAIIFPGKSYGLHNRVFINSLGLPTYEAKELGLAPAKFQDFPYDLSVIVTGNEINEYFKVLMKALSLIAPDLEKKTVHIGHGMVRLPEGKMSSRTGQIITGEWLLDEVKKKVKDEYGNDEETAEKISLAAIKWALLKSGIGRDVIFDFSKSIAVEGNSGPYIQYTCVRTKSVFEKIKSVGGDLRVAPQDGQTGRSIPTKNELNTEELSLLRTLYKFPEVVQSAADNYAPNLICNFLFDLAQKFNNFYAKHRIIEGERVNEFRLFLTQKTGEVLKHGMEILNLPVVEKM